MNEESPIKRDIITYVFIIAITIIHIPFVSLYSKEIICGLFMVYLWFICGLWNMSVCRSCC